MTPDPSTKARNVPFLIRGGPITFGNHVLWPIAVLCWSLPVVWRIGNWISDARFHLYNRYHWEWT